MSIYGGAGWNYPAGSMKGSGIYETTITAYRECGAPVIMQNFEGEPIDEVDCAFVGDVDLNIDDWGNATWVCPTCGATHEEDRTDAGPDPDFERDMRYDY